MNTNIVNRLKKDRDFRKLTFSVIMLVLLCVLLLTSCSAKYSPASTMEMAESDGTYYNGASVRKADSYSDNNYVYDIPEDVFGYTADYEYATGAEEEVISDINAATGRKIIYSSDFSIQTAEFDAAVKAISSLCTKYGGYYERSECYGSAENGVRNGYYTIRIPAENYRAFCNETGSIGTIVHSSENNQDVTENYFDTEARLQSAEIREERLLEILSKADDLNDVLLLEKELADVRYEIECFSGTLRKYDSLISYSTVTINLNEVYKPITVQTLPKTFGEKMSRSLSLGFENFSEGIQNLLIDATYNLPGIIIFLIIVAVIILLIRKAVKKAKKSTPPAPVFDSTGTYVNNGTQTNQNESHNS